MWEGGGGGSEKDKRVMKLRYEREEKLIERKKRYRKRDKEVGRWIYREVGVCW